MEAKEKVLATMKEAGTPLNAGKIAELSGLDKKEVKTTPDYADFEFYLCPTFDFRQELLSQCNEVEVLKPAKLREEMKEMIGKMMERYR